MSKHKLNNKSRLIFTILVALCSTSPIAASLNWSEGLCSDTVNHGANREYFNSAIKLKWRNYLGDWADLDGKPQGLKPFGSITINDTDQSQSVVLDVTTLMAQWQNEMLPNQGFLLRNMTENFAHVYSREADAGQHSPTLEVVTNVRTYQINVSADTSIRPQTYRCGGELELFSTKDSILLYFNLDEIGEFEIIQNASLNLVTDHSQYGTSDLNVFAVNIQSESYDDNTLSGQYINDYRMSFDPDVYMVESFENEDWQSNWSTFSSKSQVKVVASNTDEQFVALMGSALEVEIVEGELNGLDLTYLFKDKIGSDVEEVYFRYYLRLGNSWQVNDAGKLPGIGGTYTGESYKGGWGGRKSTGSNGWSVRGRFDLEVQGNNPYNGMTPLGGYLYHADQRGHYGDVEVYDGQQVGILKKNKWIAIEQYVKVNTPGVNNGIVRTWIDGLPAYERKNIKFRDEHSEHIKIDRVWMNVYHGGVKAIEKSSKVYFDNIVIAKKYIGPIHKDPAKPVAGQEPNLAPIFNYVYPSHQHVQLNYSEQVSFEVFAEDSDGQVSSIHWFVNGKLVNSGTNYLDFERSLFELGEIDVTVVATDNDSAEVVHRWTLLADQGDWSEMTLLADTHLKSSTYTSRGGEETLLLSPETTAYLSFENTLLQDKTLRSAYLVLSDTEQYGELELAIYRGVSGWVEGIGYEDGATRKYMNYGSQIEWQNFMGDWFDYDGTANGDSPFVLTYIEDANAEFSNVIDVTNLVQAQAESRSLEVVLKALAGNHIIKSSENTDIDNRPKLLVVYETGF